jgi:hypothetical protein
VKISRLIIVCGLILSLTGSAMGITVMSRTCPMAKKRSNAITSYAIKTKSCCADHKIFLRVEHEATLYGKVSSDILFQAIIAPQTPLLFSKALSELSRTSLSESSDSSPPSSIFILRI